MTKIRGSPSAEWRHALCTSSPSFMQENTARDASFPPEEAPTRRLPHALRQIGRPAAPPSLIRIRKVANDDKAEKAEKEEKEIPSTRSMQTLPAPDNEMDQVPTYVPRPTPIIIMPDDLG